MSGVTAETASLTSRQEGVVEYGATQTGTTEFTEEPEDDPFTVDETIPNVTRRLRCLFATITWPIVPLGTLVSLGLLWVLYAAFVSDMRAQCSHPLHGYAVASLVIVIYAPYHGHVRSFLFRQYPAPYYDLQNLLYMFATALLLHKHITHKRCERVDHRVSLLPAVLGRHVLDYNEKGMIAHAHDRVHR